MIAITTNNSIRVKAVRIDLDDNDEMKSPSRTVLSTVRRVGFEGREDDNGAAA